ncbi:MAG TPA: 23S rRNA (adenine(2503)-C(2))-methyltransferase RlmN [Ignavibacteriaceae bacterium]|jgi:23S rRNA (adenine2503-C2)-methyltransferase|nr:MAG: Dual-specificity RNA methyltransferase RlmN [Ignavibacteria bacterium ADurb.Bin266]OQY71768.1 MAG: 23S rRNA (adenine(2503)-C(2))-methyltransferase [Ignavibacteriales bacterium UTCHB2]HQF43328.1 23S rRNA (adenine(2503)-C(2))-methyltransferase RlmN [Ignavibacteriaceae bacterium]HQI41511.1 23S rRNA (adenine(2503)-C(2))-methyltransferase RlmN [Ignavibacteriaceae bacterium]HQJ47176.1 23S rRNA (adenine(2503)-C(2))-methyltransferase RlmN [Ignavibacteriaceae bacterium]
MIEEAKTEEPVKKTLLKGLTPKELKDFFAAVGEKRFRGDQLFEWVYGHMVENFDEMTTLPNYLRKKLNLYCELNSLSLVTTQTSPRSGTRKYLFKTFDNQLIESVIIPEPKRITLCISTQVGCPLDCQFCATGLMGYRRNLSPAEILDQFLLASKEFGRNKISNIVYMGMGEPLLNYANTFKSLQIFAEEKIRDISLKRVTVSTAGIAPKIIELADSGLKVKIAFSLHSMFEETRSKIMPINNKYSLAENLEAVKYYAKQTDTRITFEYIMLKDLNDRSDDLNALIKLCKSIPCKINVIPFNSIAHMNPTGFAKELEPSQKFVIDEFVKTLRDNNITVIVRYTQGDDIAAACGQLANKTISEPLAKAEVN